MSLDKEVIKQVHQLNEVVHEHTASYYHTAPLAFSKSFITLSNHSRHTFEIEYGLKDLFTIGAITKSSILMTGGTNIGKTTLAKLVLNALFGQNWHRVDMDLDFGPDTYTDTNFEVIKDGGKSNEGLLQASSFLSKPGILWDEGNRTDARLANKSLHLYEDEVGLADGSRAKVGAEMSDGGLYQLRVSAMNKGAEYTGTFEMDLAFLARNVIEIPMDIFPPTPFDRLRLQREKKSRSQENKVDHVEEIYSAYKTIEQNLSLSPVAELFISYLEAFDYCKNSLTKKKGSVASRNGSIHHICTQPVREGDTEGSNQAGCEFLRAFENDLCPYVQGIPGGISEKLRDVAKGFAVLRATKFAEMVHGYAEGEQERPLSYSLNFPERFEGSLQHYTKTQLGGHELAHAAVDKYIQELAVEKEDIQSAIGFVGYSKIGIAPPWINKHYQGNKYEAIKVFVRGASQKFEESLGMDELKGISEILGGSASEEVLQKVEQYCTTYDPWLWKAITGHLTENLLSQQKPLPIAELYGN